MKNISLLFLIAAAGALLGSSWANTKKSDPLRPQANIVNLQSAPHRQTPSQTADVHVLAKGENAFMAILKMVPGAKVPLHRDSDEEYIYILEGKGTIQIDGKKHTLQKGDAVYMPANAEVTFENGDQPLVGLQVFAGPKSADKYLKWPAAATE